MNAKRRTLAVLAAVIAVLGLALWALNRSTAAEEAASSAAADGTIPLCSFSTADLSRITYTYNGQTLTLDDADGSFSHRPDLILLDGGRGHVSVVRGLMRERGLDIPVFGMVKDDFHKTRALCTEDEEISIAREREVFVLVYKLQEEVHRFTVSRMSAAKGRTLTHSSLTRIPGIGDAKAKRLLSALGGLAAVRAADEDALSAVPGISRADAARIRAYFAERASGGAGGERP